MIRRFATVIAAVAVAFTGAGVVTATHAGAATTGSRAFVVPNTGAGFIPQGMTQWGSRVIVAEYRPGSNTRLVAINPASGTVYGSLAIAENHAGGIAIVGGWLFVQDQPHVAAEAIRRYRMSDVVAGLSKSHKGHGHPAYVASAGLQQLDAWQYASFMTADHGQLLSGHYGVGTGSRMYRYDVNQATGALTATPGYVIAPDRTQGVAVTVDGSIVFTSYRTLTVGTVSRAIPAHAEGVVVIGGRAYVAFEGSRAANVLSFVL